MPDISLTPSVIFSLGPLDVTNSVLGAFLITCFFAVFALAVSRRMDIVPTRIQTGLELITEYILEQLENAFGDSKKAREFFPLVMTLLLFLLIANQFTLVPVIADIAAGEVSIFSLPPAHLSLTIGLAIFIVLIANVLAFTASPLRYIGTFITIKPLLEARSFYGIFDGFIQFFLGLLNIISEIAKIFSLSFRLFGNIFAGEVMVVVIASLSVFTQFIVPMPFIVISIFSGLIQAFVFVLLSMQYIAGSLASVKPVTEAS